MYIRSIVSLLALLSLSALCQESILDARQYNFSSRPLSLQANWKWVDGELLEPGQIYDQAFSSIQFPSLWNDVRENKSGQGVATYALAIVLPAETKSYAIELPQIYSSYRLWLNENVLAENGKPGIRPELTNPQWLPQTVSFSASDTIHLLLQIANFNHYKGGCREAIYLGEQSAMLAKHRTTQVSKVVQCVTMLFLSLIFIGIYVLWGKKKILVYFSLLCLTWAIRSAFSNEYLIAAFFPDFNWDILVRTEYITLYLTMIWAILFLNRLFPREGNTILKYIIVILNSIFVGFTLMAKPVTFTQLLNVYLGTAGVVILYGLFVIIRAFVNGRKGAAFLSISALLGLILFSYDLFTYEGLFSYNSVLFNVGYIFLFILMGIALLANLTILNLPGYSSDTLNYNDLYKD